MYHHHHQTYLMKMMEYSKMIKRQLKNPERNNPTVRAGDGR
jgi:hypothetical protein